MSKRMNLDRHPRKLSHAIGFDDFPFDRAHRGDVGVVGVVCAGGRVDGVLTGKVRRDGANAARSLAAMVRRSHFREHLHLILLQGIALAGFNVVDLGELRELTSLPVLVVARKKPDMWSIRRALLDRVPGGARKWRLIEKAGPMERAGAVFVQRCGLTLDEAGEVVARFAIHSVIPEPLRLAHMIAGGIARGESGGRA